MICGRLDGVRDASAERSSARELAVASGTARGLAIPAATAIVLVGALHLATRNHQFNPADEGFLWYGVQRTLAGEVPLRDFQSYEPGRYYVCALVGLLRGRGILAVRDALAVVQAIGLFAGLLAARRALPRPWMLVPAGVVLLLWMFPRHKAFEPALAMLAIYAAVRILEDPGRRTLLLAGAGAGLAAFFGRNHGLYWVTALAASTLLSSWNRRDRAWPRALATLALGIVIGSLPLFGMLAFVPGFGAALVRSIAFYARQGANLPVPYHWPWRLGFEHLRAFERAALGAVFLLPVIVVPLALLVALRRRPEFVPATRLVAAAACVGVAYAHHAAVRSDIEHLAQCLHPALLCGLGLAALGRRTDPLIGLALGRRAVARVAVALAALLLVTAIAVPATNPVLAGWRIGVERTGRVRFDAAGEELLLDPVEARYLEELERAVRDDIPPSATLFVAPELPGLYPLLGRTAPTFETYFLWPLSDDEQRAIVARLESRSVDRALIADPAPNGSLSLRRLAPLVWRHLSERFEPIAERALPPGHYLLRRR